MADDAIKAMAASLAPIFEAKGYGWGWPGVVPGKHEITATLARLYRHATENPEDFENGPNLHETGRIVLITGDGEIFKDSVRVLLDIGELPLPVAVESQEAKP